MINIAKIIAFFASILITACEHQITKNSYKNYWNIEDTRFFGSQLQLLEGRIALSLYNDALPGQVPDKQFSSAFQLQGNADTGQMQLTSPLGNVLASLEWSPTRARLRNGPETQDFASLDAMLPAVTGAALPSRALLAWLRGEAVQVEGWTVDLSAHAHGRIQAERHHPKPVVELRVVLD